MSKKEQLKEALELTGLKLSKVQGNLSKLEKEIRQAEEAIEKAQVVVKVDPSLSSTMKRRVESSTATILDARRKEAVLLEREGELSRQKQLLEKKFYEQAQKTLDYRKAQKNKEKEKEVVVKIVASSHKSYGELMRSLRLLRDGKNSSGPTVKADLSKEKVQEELECVQGLIEKSNEWFKKNGRDNPGFKSKLADAEYLFKCKKDLVSVINS